MVFTHQIEGDDWEDVPGCSASLPTYQLLSKPKPRGKLFCLKSRDRRIFSLSFPKPVIYKSGLRGEAGAYPVGRVGKKEIAMSALKSFL